MVVIESKVSSDNLRASIDPEPIDDFTDYQMQEHDKMRYKEFVTDAHKAKDRSSAMVNRLLERAQRQNDKKAVAILMDK